MEVEKNRLGSKCRWCRKNIIGKYRVASNGNHYFHLTCYFGYVNRNLKAFKESRKKLMRYGNHMVIERLQV